MRNRKVLLAGCGLRAKVWVRDAVKRDHVEIVGLVDLSEANARAMAAEFGLAAPTFTNVAEALASTEADLLFDITVPASRKDVVSAALTHGLDVFAEKPMAATLEEARELVRLAAETGRTYSIMQNRRYLPRIRSLRDTLATGMLGAIGEVHADFFLGPHFGGFRDAMESPLILDMAIHTFDQARFLTGANPVSVYCHEFNPPGSWYAGDASAICIFEMSDGSVFCYRGSWCAEGFRTPWEGNWRIIGEKGTALWENDRDPVFEIVEEAKPDGFLREYAKPEIPVVVSSREGDLGCFDDMFDALAEGRPADTDATDNIHSIAMVHAAMESARRGEKVPIQV
jgi:predicted dehydrogenase